MTNNTNNTDSQNETLDLLLKERQRRQQLAELKRQIPMPAEDKKRSSLKIILTIILLALLVGSLVVFSVLKLNNNPKAIAEELIADSQMVDLRNMNIRGQESREEGIQAFEAEFYKAHELLKGDSQGKEEALILLSEITKSKNKFQIESIWLKSLGLIALEKYDQAQLELNKLKAFSKYQNKNVEHLLKLLEE